MYIVSITSQLSGIGRALLGLSEKAAKRETLFGEFKDLHISIDRLKDEKGTVLQKRYVVWNDMTQLVWYKNRNSQGKFDLLV